MYLTGEQKIGLLFVLVSLVVGTFLLNKRERGVKVTSVLTENRQVSTSGVLYPVDINSADSSLLIKIPGIGPRIAHKILEYRRKKGKFKNIEELLEIKGIGPRKLERMKPYMEVK